MEFLMREERRRAADLVFAGATYQEAANFLRISRSAVAGAVRDARPPNSKPKKTCQQSIKTSVAVNLVQAGYAVAQAAQLAGVNDGTVRRALKRAGLR